MSTDVVLRFGVVVGSVLGGAGASIVVIERLRRRPLRDSVLSRRWLTWVALSALWILAISSPAARFAVLSVLGTTAGFEYARLARMRSGDRTLCVILPLAGLAITHISSIGAALSLLLLAATLPALVVQDVDHGSQRTSKLMIGVLVAALPMMSLLVLGAEAIAVMVAVLFGVALSDVCAFLAGSILGSHRMAPILSPNKTWEGALGNLLGAVAGVGLSGLVFPLPTSGVVLVSGLVAVGALWGDLFESLLKRTAHVKDAGRILPGFGGVLDRLDSLIVAAPLVLSSIGLVG